MGRNHTGPPCSFGRQSPTSPAAARRPHTPAALQTTTDYDDRRLRAKQYWPIRRASNEILQMCTLFSLYRLRSTIQYSLNSLS